MTYQTKTVTTDDAEADAAETLSPAKVRKAAGLTEGEMAELMGMNPNGYGLWERGMRRPGGPAFRLLRLIQDDAARVKRVLSTD
ncbi:helix-turn-helix domain-containing protein [Aliiroseovarius subalbicans]|uniref:helix-turn-helix domain-containing protein n=1 Tax=Aliiroseovarius subalbicans TaxID=2925840 RepID=UPI001F5776BB|nr:helix-turn-helix domain-containing protein [Aliiroseovarius subalbicans]MCI2400515.1 helix-turn-helix domain-containing protein [Aliiroseovarius subalbicans]